MLIASLTLLAPLGPAGRARRPRLRGIRPICNVSCDMRASADERPEYGRHGSIQLKRGDIGIWDCLLCCQRCVVGSDGREWTGGRHERTRGSRRKR